MNAPPVSATMAQAVDTPAFLLKNEPDAEYALWSNGRFVIVKAGVSLSLSRDDLRGLCRYFDQFAEEP